MEIYPVAIEHTEGIWVKLIDVEQARAEERERCATALEAWSNDLLKEGEHYDAKITREAATIIREME